MALSAMSTSNAFLISGASCYAWGNVRNAAIEPQMPQNQQTVSRVLSLGERKQALTRDTLFESAILLFVEKGFDETTVEDIAQAAGTSRRSFFRYFDSKNDLMAQPLVSYGTALTDAIRACPRSLPPMEVLRRTFLTVGTASATNPLSRKVMEIAAKYPSARQAQLARVAELQDQVAEAFAERFSKDLHGRTSARVLAALTHSLLSVIFQNWFEEREQDISINVEQVLSQLQRIAGSKAPKV